MKARQQTNPAAFESPSRFEVRRPALVITVPPASPLSYLVASSSALSTQGSSHEKSSPRGTCRSGAPSSSRRGYQILEASDGQLLLIGGENSARGSHGRLEFSIRATEVETEGSPRIQRHNETPDVPTTAVPPSATWI